MIITNETNINEITEMNDVFKFSDDITEDNLIRTLNFIYEYELENKKSCSLYLKNLSQELKLSIFNNALTNENLVNSNIILNIFNLIKGYNTFEDSFFEHNDVIFKDLEEYLDIKIELNRNLGSFIKNLIFYYLSIIRSCGITEYTNEMNPIDIPMIYQRILSISDIVSLSSIFMKSPNIETNDLVLVNNAYQYMALLSSNFNFANKLMGYILNGN